MWYGPFRLFCCGLFLLEEEVAVVNHLGVLIEVAHVLADVLQILLLDGTLGSFLVELHVA